MKIRQDLKNVYCQMTESVEKILQVAEFQLPESYLIFLLIFGVLPFLCQYCKCAVKTDATECAQLLTIS